MDTIDSKKSPNKIDILTRFGVEFIGTAFITFTIYFFSTIIFVFNSLNTSLTGVGVLFTVVTTAIAYAAVLGTFGRISNGHFNPAITITSILIGRSRLIELLYIVAQVLGSIFSALVLILILPHSNSLPIKTWFSSVANGYGSSSMSANLLKSVNLSFEVTTAIVIEIIAVILIVSAYIILTKDNGKYKKNFSSTMGIVYALGALITYPITGVGLNPARSTGIAFVITCNMLKFKSFKAFTQTLLESPSSKLWVFWVAPIFASAIVGLVILLGKLIKDYSMNTVANVSDANSNLRIEELDSSANNELFYDAKSSDTKDSNTETNEDKSN